MVSRVLENTGVMVQPGAILYKAVVHTVLFYGIKVAGLWPIREYVWRRQAKIAEYGATRPIFELCTGVQRMPGFSQILRWWDKDNIREGCNV